MAANVGNIDVILNTTDVVAPVCPHGPALLFSKYDTQSGQERRFFSCSAFRDRKECSFFQWENETVSSKTLAAREDVRKRNKPLFSHRQFRKRFLQIKKLQKEDRNFCINCGLLLLPEETTQHEGQGHKIRRSLTKQLLKRPTELFSPFDNNKTYAQYLFSKATVEFVISTLKRLSYTHIVCVGCPRIHEAIQGQSVENDGESLKSLLLDLDQRYLQVYTPQKFCQYNMFNHYFFSGTRSEDIFKKFITEDYGKRVAMVIDPPFGGMVEALACSISKIDQQWQLSSGYNSENHLPVLWFFPYFMEKRIVECCPTFTMLDYKVDYDNHSLFTGNKGRKQGSPVRLFTNISPAGVVLPSEEGYWFCEKCQRYSSKENQHCDICEACTTKDGRTYIHCDKCGRCVKPSRVHCDSCNICDIPGHQCGKVKSTGCHICGQMGHKRRDCPNKNRCPDMKSTHQSTKRKHTEQKHTSRKKRKR